VFCVVVHGICRTGDLKKVGRVDVKALLYFEPVTPLALAGYTERGSPRPPARPCP